MGRNVYTLLFKVLTGVLLLTLSATPPAAAQTDTVFWFAAPDISPVYAPGPNGNRRGDRPIVLRLITDNQPATVTISQPAGGGMPTQSITIPANTSQKFDLTTWVDNIANNPPNVVLDYGLKIKSDVPIFAYYHLVSGDTVIGYVSNPEIFTLKGRSALGTDFWIPAQDNYDNDNIFAFYNRMAFSSFAVVATEDNTAVTITPAQDIVGHTAGTPFVIHLDQGQTYSALAATYAAAGHLAGSEVTADKPIAITVADDQMRYFGGDDAGGDQIVPSSLLGTRYVAINGDKMVRSGDFIYVTATEDNTSIYIDGNATAVATINQGATWRRELNAPATLIETTHPVSVYQLSGVDRQPAQTQLPQLSACNGSQSISYSRSVPRQLIFHVIVPAGGENDFTINGNAGTLTGAMFSPVPGTNNNWLYCRLDLNDVNGVTYPLNKIIKIENSSHPFHLAVLEGDTYHGFGIINSTLGSSYSYFSDFGMTATSGNLLGADTAICEGNVVTLDATTTGADSYEWSTGQTTPTIQVSQSGAYWVKLTGNLCVDKDTITVTVHPLPVVDLGPDTSVCNTSSLDLQSRRNYNNAAYLWSTNAATPSIKVDQTGLYALTVTENGCVGSDSILVTFDTLLVDLGNDTVLCEGQSIILNSSIPYSLHPTFRWNTGATTSSIRVNESGLYLLSVTDEGCTGSDSVRVTVPHLAQNLGKDTLLCEETPINLTLQGNVPEGSYALWSTGENTPDIYVDKAGTYWVTVTQAPCFGSDTMTVRTRKCDCEVFVPNAFTPNGDGLNDLVIPKFNPGCPVLQYSFKVFNRYGQLVYRSNKEGEGWKGVYANGRPADVGTYFYIVNYKTLISANDKIKRGDITLIR